MTGSVRKLYANGITAQGFYSLYSSIREHLDYVFIIKGAPGTGKSTLINNIAQSLTEKGVNIEIIRSPKDNDALDGLLIPNINMGLLVHNPPFTIEAKYIGVLDEEIDLNGGLSLSQLAAQKRQITNLIDNIQNIYQQAVTHLATAKEIHLERESIYLEHMNFDMANKVTEELITEIFSNHMHKDGKSTHRRLFLGATTPEGVVNSIDNITERVQKRVIIKGRAGSGKSTILNKIVQEATKQGVDTEIFQCGFDPSSLDMVVLPELGFAVLDGTPPHPIEPSRSGDLVLDMYELCFTKDVDTDSAEKLKDVVTRYKAQTTVAIELIREAKELNDQLKHIYTEAMDFTKNDIKQDYMLNKILANLN